MPRDLVQEHRDLRIAVAGIQAYNNISVALNISEGPSRAKRTAFSILTVKHIFTQLERHGVNELPFFPRSANAYRVVETASDFVEEYGNRLWPERSNDVDAVSELTGAVKEFIFVMLTLHVKASKVNDDEDTLIDQFHDAEFDEEDEPISAVVGEEIPCPNCDAKYPDRNSLEVHYHDCIANYRHHPGPAPGPAGPESIPRSLPRW